MEHEPTTGELLEVINKGFQGVQDQLTGMNSRIDSLDQRSARVELRLETDIATKDFVERRLARTDGKINSLINVLEKKRIITQDEKRAIHL